MDKNPERQTDETHEPPSPSSKGRIDNVRRVLSNLRQSFVDTFEVNKKITPGEVTDQNVAQAIVRLTGVNSAFYYKSLYAEFEQIGKLADPRVEEAIRIHNRRLVEAGVLGTINTEGSKGEIVPFFQIRDERLLQQIVSGKVSVEELLEKKHK